MAEYLAKFEKGLLQIKINTRQIADFKKEDVYVKAKDYYLKVYQEFTRTKEILEREFRPKFASLEATLENFMTKDDDRRIETTLQ